MSEPPAPRPRYFVSAVTPEFHTLRTKTADVLRFLGYEPEVMDIWGTEDGDLRELLKRKIDACDGLVHIVGRAYGAEPPVIDEAMGRVSYTQFEFLYARARGKKTWLLVAGDECVRERPLDQLDLPKAGHPDPAGYQAERRHLQEDYLAARKQDGHLRHGFDSAMELENAVLKLRNDSEELRQQFRAWQQQVVESQRRIEVGQHRLLKAVLTGAIALCLLGGGAAWWLEHRASVSATATQATVADLDTQKAFARGRAEKEFAAEKALIANSPDPDEREKQTDKLKADHERQLAAIDRVFETLRIGYSKGEINEITEEFRNILNTEGEKGGIDRALAFFARKEPEALNEAKRHFRERDEDERNARAALRTFLVAAQEAAIKKRPDEAAELYGKIFGVDPDWPEALEAAGWFWFDRADFESTEGSFAKAVEAIETALKFVERKKPRIEPGEKGRRLEAAVQSMFGDILMTRGQSGDADKALAAYERDLKISEELLTANPGSAQAARDVSVSLERLAGFYLQRGQSGDADQALAHYERALKLREDLLTANPGSAQAARDVSVSLNQLAGFYLQRGQSGDADKALAYYERALKLREDLLTANPSSTQAARDVSVSLEELAGFYLQRGQSGDIDKALAAYERCLKVLEGLLTANPGSAQAIRDVSVSLNQLADFYIQRGQSGDADKALAAYERCLKVLDGLLTANPGSAQAARDVSISLDRLGDFHIQRGQRGDADQALTYYERSLKLREELLTANPGSAQAARDVSVSLNKLADFYLQRGQSSDADKALAAFERSLKLAEDLLTANPGSAQAARDVSISLEKLAGFYLQRGQNGDADKALAYYQRALKLREDLRTANPGSAQAARDVSISLNKLADFYLQRGQNGDADQALAYYQRCLKVLEGLLTANPGSAQAIRDVVVSHFQMAQFYLKQHQEAAANDHLKECHRILKKAIEAGFEFDAPIKNLYDTLQKDFANSK